MNMTTSSDRLLSRGPLTNGLPSRSVVVEEPEDAAAIASAN
jgi:hypothetical protein